MGKLIKINNNHKLRADNITENKTLEGYSAFTFIHKVPKVKQLHCKPFRVSHTLVVNLLFL